MVGKVDSVKYIVAPSNNTKHCKNCGASMPANGKQWCRRCFTLFEKYTPYVSEKHIDVRI